MLVSDARVARQQGVVAFTKFMRDVKSNRDKLFCFFEGEDYKYYGQRIETYTLYSYSNIIQYKCCGRNEVLRANKLVKNNIAYKLAKTAFFIDHDYIPVNELSDDIYQTPCYSIENLYTSVSSFERIINMEFGISTHEPDYIKCVNDYRKRQLDFQQHTLILNAWLRFQRIEEKRTGGLHVELTNFKLQKMIPLITIEKIECKGPIDIDAITKYFPDHYPITQDELNLIIESCCFSGCERWSRGKFELFFLIKIIEDLRTKNKNKEYFEESRTSVEIVPSNNTLSVLSRYADTPHCLIEFLKRYKKC